MILRRITEHVKAQNWFAVGIDFVIVVVGVFIGIQVANWNDARAINSKSILFTERLKADLRNEAWNHQYLVEYYEDVKANGHRALNALTGKSDLSDEALLVSAYRATQYLENNRSRSVFDELTSTGSLDLIRDDSLRGLAQWVYNEPVFDGITDGNDNGKFRQKFRMIVPLEVQDALLEKCGDRDVEFGNHTDIVDSLDYPCETGLPSALIGETAYTLRGEPSMIPLLRLRNANVKTFTTNLTSFNKERRRELQAVVGETS